MAVTGSLFKGFTFGDISSKAYGVYITQEAAYDSPEKDVETFEIAGRNGAFVLDNGRFRNISVSYICGIAESTEATFESAVRAFRNALSAVAGQYVRLTDDYNPSEYREAAFLGGIDVSMADRRAGEFTVTFDAKPQRFLTSGETAVEVTSGGTITNPTLFKSRPLLQVWGYGDISINGETISIDDTVIGEFVMLAGTTSSGRLIETIPVDKLAALNSGDDITTTVTIDSEKSVRAPSTIRTTTATVVSGTATASVQTGFDYTTSATKIRIPLALSYGTPASFEVRTNITIEGFDYTVGSFTDEWYERTTVTYDGDATIRILSTSGATSVSATSDLGSLVSINEIIGNSTKSALGEPLYFDLDIGEAYKLEDDAPVSVNNAVSFAAELPTLDAGENTITFDNTVQTLKIVPRWWEV